MSKLFTGEKYDNSDIWNSSQQKEVNSSKIFRYGDILIKKVARPWLQIPVISKVFGYTAMEDEYVRVLHEFTNSVRLYHRGLQ